MRQIIVASLIVATFAMLLFDAALPFVSVANPPAYKSSPVYVGLALLTIPHAGASFVLLLAERKHLVESTRTRRTGPLRLLCALGIILSAAFVTIALISEGVTNTALRDHPNGGVVGSLIYAMTLLILRGVQNKS